MKVLSLERQELIDALVAETVMGGITAGLLEKDEHLTDALRPHLQIELTARSPVLVTVTRQIGSLADHLAGRQDQVCSVPTVAIAETVAAKVLPFLRRYAQHRASPVQAEAKWDTALVRHIYDAHCVYRRHPDIVAMAAKAFPEIVASDQNEFGGQFPDFASAALPVLSGALKQASGDAQIQVEYSKNLIPLIYGNEAPEFAEAFESFEAVAGSLLMALQESAATDALQDTTQG